jgi:hypothetical protein
VQVGKPSAGMTCTDVGLAPDLGLDLMQYMGKVGVSKDDKAIGCTP